jgi:hypothetical protein
MIEHERIVLLHATLVDDQLHAGRQEVAIRLP